MNLLRPIPRYQPPQKQIEKFINTAIYPIQQIQQSTFLNQNIYKYATRIANQSPQLFNPNTHYYTHHHTHHQNHIGLHYTHNLHSQIQHDSNRNQTKNKNSRVYSSSQASNLPRSSLTNKKQSSNFSQNYYMMSDQLDRSLDMQNVSKTNKKQDWKSHPIPQKVIDHKKQHYKTDDYTRQPFSEKVRDHDYRSSAQKQRVLNWKGKFNHFKTKTKDFEITKNRKQQQQKPTLLKLSLLQNPNYVNFDKYRFPNNNNTTTNKLSNDQPKNIQPWKSIAKNQTTLLQNPKTSLIYQKRMNFQRPIKQLDVDQKKLGDESISLKKIKKTSLNKVDQFSSRGVYDLLYPRAFTHHT